jgi:hypothetical protein
MILEDLMAIAQLFSHPMPKTLRSSGRTSCAVLEDGNFATEART